MIAKLLELNVCQQSPLDEEVRYDCYSCSDRKAHLYVVRRVSGWYGFCQKCGFRGFRRSSVLDRLASRKKSDGEGYTGHARKYSGLFEYDQEGFRVPTGRIGPYWLNYLHQYITDTQIMQYGLQEHNGKLILPCYDWKGEVIGYQSRTRSGKPKYITTKRYKDRPIFSAIPARLRHESVGNSYKAPVYTVGGHVSGAGSDGECMGLRDQFVIVEDILSAIRISTVLWDKHIFAILGSPERIGDGSLHCLWEGKTLEGSQSQVIVWYDFDKRSSALKVCKRLNQLPDIKAVPMWTERDPKALTDEEIVVKINHVLCD